MFNAFKEGIRRAFGGNDKAVIREIETIVGPVNEEKLWVDMVKQMITCMKNGGFSYQIEETPPPFQDLQFGTHCEVVVRDEEENCYEVALSSFHYPGDRGESQILHVKQGGDKSNVSVWVGFRSNVSMIGLSPDFAVRKDRWISGYPRKLDFSEELQQLGKLGRVTVDKRKTLELLNERRQRDCRSVAWIRDVPLLSAVLE